MKTAEIAAWLQKPLYELEVSTSFYEQSKMMGFENLESILSVNPKVMTRDPAFSYEWLAELILLLKQKDLAHLLQPIPGKSSD